MIPFVSNILFKRHLLPNPHSYFVKLDRDVPSMKAWMYGSLREIFKQNFLLNIWPWALILGIVPSSAKVALCSILVFNIVWLSFNNFVQNTVNLPQMSVLGPMGLLFFWFYEKQMTHNNDIWYVNKIRWLK